MNKKIVSNLLMAPAIVFVVSVLAYYLYMLATENMMDAIGLIVMIGVLFLFLIGIKMSNDEDYANSGGRIE